LAGNDLIYGNGGDDTLTGGSGIDALYGGEGNDTLNFDPNAAHWSFNFVGGYIANADTGENISISAYNRNYDVFDGGPHNDTLNLTSGNDALILHDNISGFAPGLSAQARIVSVETINGGNGNDLIDLTSPMYVYGNVTINGGDGDDVIWSSVGDDTISGGLGNDSLFGGDGNDVISGGSGVDKLYGHDGNDILAISNTTFQLIDGGSGTDTLRLDGTLDLDLTAIANSKTAGIEIIDITGNANNTLRLNLQDILDMSDTSNTLQIDGDAGDTMAFYGGSLTSEADQVINSVNYNVYSGSGANLLVNEDVGIQWG
jgi:hypothetical protein